MFNETAALLDRYSMPTSSTAISNYVNHQHREFVASFKNYSTHTSPEMSTGPFSVNATRPADHTQTTDQTRPTYEDVKSRVFKPHSINILHGVKFIFKNITITRTKSMDHYNASTSFPVEKKISRIFDPTPPAILYENLDPTGPVDISRTITHNM